MLTTAPISPGSSGTVSLRVLTETLTVETSSAPEFVDLTALVADVVTRSGVEQGVVVVFSQHTTAAIRVNEAEPLLLEDVSDCLDRLAPRQAQYRHNDFHVRTVNMTQDESPNGHSHCQHLLMGASESIPIVNGSLALGRWQRVFLVELDHGRRRDAIVQVMGLG
ncbi:MAG: YjbQ family protein [Chloroflexi bacterium]|nr:YjbQ family protein [Chloroflexota bacterium]